MIPILLCTGDDVKGMRIGIPKDYFGEGLNPEVKDSSTGSSKSTGEKGAIVEEFDLWDL